MISQYLCQRGLSQQVEENMSGSEAAIREYPAATHSAVWHPLRHTQESSKKPQKKMLLYQVTTNRPVLHALYLLVQLT